MSDKTVQVIEYEPITRDRVGSRFFEELEAFAQENENLFLGYSRRGVLKAQNYVGIIQTKSGFTLEILPKIAKEDNKELSKELLLKMLKTLKNSPFKYSQKANLKTQNFPLLEIFIEMFLDELAILVKRGIKNDYITKEENQQFLKGRLKIKEQISKNFIHKERFYVEYDEYLPDRIENKIIKTTLKKLRRISESAKNQQRIREFLFVFDEVGEVKKIKSAFTKIKNDRSINYYQTVLLWSKIFLLNQSFTPYKGSTIAFALLFDMNRLFESYVGYQFKKKCKNVKLQDRRYHLFDEPKKFALKPDILIFNKEEIKIILDTKWKIIKNEKEVSQNDLYQMFAYANRYEKCEKVYLIYPYIDEIKTTEFCVNFNNRKVTFKAIFYDLINNHLRPSNELLHYPKIFCD